MECWTIVLILLVVYCLFSQNKEGGKFRRGVKRAWRNRPKLRKKKPAPKPRPVKGIYATDPTYTY